MSNWHVNTFWSNAKEFEFDAQPSNVLFSYGGYDTGVHYVNQNLFELDGTLQNIVLNQYNSWTNWIAKIQPDYRFLQISDINSQTIVFPEVDDPWMFTEYVYQGTGKIKDNELMTSKDYIAIEPSLYSYVDLSVINEAEFKQIDERGWYGWKHGGSNADYDKERYHIGLEGVKLYKANIAVESVKWGEHGNIPDNTVNMTAPESWLDAGGYNVTIKPVYTTKIGIPLYTSDVGQFYYTSSKNLYIANVSYTEQTNGDETYWTYDVVNDGGVRQAIPEVARTSTQASTLIFTPNKDNGDIIHHGCTSFVGKAGTLRCKLYDILNETERAKLNINFAKCMSNNECPYFTKGDDSVEIASYEAKANNYQEQQDAIDGLRIDADGYANPNKQYSKDGITLRQELTFEYVNTPANPRVLQVNPRAQFQRNAYYERGTGQFALDTKEGSSEIGGVDEIYFGDINQLSFHRFMTNCMHCYDPKQCNDVIGVKLQSGYQGKPANVDGEPFCNYWRQNEEYGVGCPSDCTDKRAFEYQEMMQRSWVNCSQIASGFLIYLNNDLLEDYTSYYTVKKNIGNLEVYDLFSDKDESETMGGIYCLMGDGNANDYFIEGVKRYFICRIVLKKVEEVYDVENIYAWYQQYDFNSNKINKNGLPWFIKLEPNYPKAQKFAYYVTNEEKFIGGYHPQYKDVSRRGSEFLFQEENTDFFRDAIGDTGVGDPDYDKVKNPVNTVGYWTDESGEWIIDGRSLGGEMGTMENKQARLSNGSGAGVCIAHRMSNTMINGETGEKTDPVCERCAVYSNDTAEMISLLIADPPRNPPKEEGGEGDPVPPHISNVNGLPKERPSKYCPTCDTTLYPRSDWQKCTWCNGNLINRTGAETTQFYRTKAMGSVQVYAPAGSVISTKAYFWKNPTVVSNSILAQIRFKLGNINKNAGGYNTTGVNSETEAVDRLEPDVGFYRMGFPKTGNVKEDKNNEKYSDNVAYNPVTDKKTLPKGFYNLDEDNSVINPFNSDSGLKMITSDYMVEMRNLLQPTLGYVIGGIDKTLDYQVVSANFDNRRAVNSRRTQIKDPGKVKPQILAGNSTGMDTYIQYWSGDPEIGSVRDYYPPGLSWWLMNWVIGGRGTTEEGEWYHMDDDEAGNKWTCYAGQVTESKCFFFLHGSLPLDKEIVKAYAIVKPSSLDCSRNPLGVGWNGKTHYEHYHAFWKGDEHEYQGVHLHGADGRGNIYDNDGKLTSLQDELRPREEIELQDDFAYETIDEKTGSPNYWMTMEPEWFSHYEKPNWMTSFMRHRFFDQTYNGLSLQNVLKWDGWGTDIYQDRPENALWKSMTESELRELQNENLAEVEFYIGDEDSESSETFYRYNPEFVSQVLPSQMQSIPDYFNYSGYNSTGSASSKINYVKKTTDTSWNNDGQIITQADDDGNSDGYGGDIKAGEEVRVFDVTDRVKEAYNERIDRYYYADFGKSFEDMLSYQYSVSQWKGANTENQTSFQERLNWNPTEYDQFGYKLNENNRYPRLIDSIPVMPSNNGDKYNPNFSDPTCFGNSGDSFAFNNHGLQVISGNTYSFTFNGIYTVSELISYMNGVIGDGNLNIKYENHLILTATGADMMSVSGSACDIIGFLAKSYTKYAPRITNTTAFKLYHPQYMINGDTDCWFFETKNNQPQSFIIDLAQYPYEEWRRDFRISPGSSDYSGCFCPNVSCVVNSYQNKKLKISVYATVRGYSYNEKASACQFCGADLTSEDGIVTKGGDTIPTFGYLSAFSSSVFVTKISVNVSATQIANFKNAFSVWGKNDDNDSWDCIKVVEYDVEDNKHYDYSSGEKVVVGNVLDIEITNKQKRYRYIKIMTYPRRFDSVVLAPRKNDNVNYFEMNLNKDYNVDYFANLMVTFSESADGEESIPYRVLASEGTKLWVDKDLDLDDKFCKVYDYRYRGGIGKVGIYGFAYNKDQITITDPIDIYNVDYSFSINKYSLPVLPNQLTVKIGNENSYFIELEQTDDLNEMYWKTTIDSIKINNEVKTFKKLASGKFYHNPKDNNIYLPLLDEDGDSMGVWEKELNSGGFVKTYLPTNLIVEYWSGRGKEITVPLSAEGLGPSYIVEKECIELDDEMPDMGLSTPLPDQDGGIAPRKIDWVCYNQELMGLSSKTKQSTGGYFIKPNFRGDELGSNYNDNKYFSELFGESCSKISGRCEGEISIYGKPDVIISGRKRFKAPAYRKLVYKTPKGELAYNERTGGLKRNGFVVGIRVRPKNKRQTLAWEQPTIVVYARERNLDEDLKK